MGGDKQGTAIKGGGREGYKEGALYIKIHNLLSNASHS